MSNSQSWFTYPSYNWKTKQATVIGGGIAGAQMAWHLCEAGWKVTLIERHTSLATEASGNPAGVISPKMTALPSDGEDFYTQSFHYTLSLIRTLEKQGKNIDWDACGALQLAHNSREEKRWKSLKDRQLPSDFIQLLDEKETMDVAGIKLHPDRDYKSCYFPNGAWINPVSFVEALCDHPNCHVIYQSEAIGFEKKNGAWAITDEQGKLINQSEVVIIANGKDLFNFKQSNFLPAMPVAGQTTLASSSAFSKQLKTVIGHEGYLTPAIGPQHTFGATFERDVSQPNLKATADSDNLRQLGNYLPEFANLLNNIQSAHVAVRMTSPDRFPYVGGLPNKDFYLENYHDLHQGKQWKEYPKAEYQDGLFVLGCLGSRGLTTSGYCAKILTELLENKLHFDFDSNTTNSKVLLLNCHPARFIIKNLKRNLLLKSTPRKVTHYD